MKYKSKKRQMKEFITSLFYDIKFFNGSITTLAGPDLPRVIKLANNLEPDVINVYETCPKTFEKQMKDKYKHFNGDDTIQLHFDDLSNAPVTEFIDADLMKTFKSDGKIIEKLIKKQVKLDAETKVFIGTVSMRKVDKLEVFEWLSKVLYIIDEVDILDKIEYQKSEGTFIYLSKYVTEMTSKIKSFDVFAYSDREGPMLTFRIVY